MLPESLDVGLKEWATVCDALGSGRQIVLLRKGGIREEGGEFELEHREFVFFPTYLHQSTYQLKEEAHAGFVPHSAEPERVRIAVAGRVTDILRVQSRQQIEEIDDQHIWAGPLLDMRFNYRPANPLYLLLVRAYRLGEAVVIENTPEYAGCKSWVPLGRGISTRGALPALDDTSFQTKRQLIRSRMEGVNTGF